MKKRLFYAINPMVVEVRLKNLSETQVSGSIVTTTQMDEVSKDGKFHLDSSWFVEYRESYYLERGNTLTIHSNHLDKIEIEIYAVEINLDISDYDCPKSFERKLHHLLRIFKSRHKGEWFDLTGEQAIAMCDNIIPYQYHEQFKKELEL